MPELNNLLTDPWISVRRRSGLEQMIAPNEITDGIDIDPIVDIVAPRPDFRSALYQFLIGLMQTAFMPEDDYEWLEHWNKPPTPEVLATRLEPFGSAFMVSGNGPLFMQDHSITSGDTTRIAALLIDEPGIQSAKLNKDHFVKSSRILGLSRIHAITALFTMQCMAPAGGAGNRTSLRGGGPLTTVLLPAESQNENLWSRLWLNVLDREAWSVVPGIQGNPTVGQEIFPWVGSIRVSDKDGSGTTPEDAHSLQHYWGMPRRVLLGETQISGSACPFSDDRRVIVDFRSKPWGVNYVGPWRHPLSPYYRTKSGEMLPFHPQPGGFQYRMWVDWAQPPAEDNPNSLCALTVSNHLRSHQRGEIPVRVWASGFDMDNMKPRCFYDAIWPIFYFSEQCRVPARNVTSSLAAIAADTARITRSQVREAWLRRPTDHSDSSNNASFGVEARVYEESETSFFGLLAQLHSLCLGTTTRRIDGDVWRNKLAQLARTAFDDYVPIESISNSDPARVARSRNGLLAKLKSKRMQSNIDDIANAMEDIDALGVHK